MRGLACGVPAGLFERAISDLRMALRLDPANEVAKFGLMMLSVAIEPGKP